ncbi:MAG: hypothetical protein ACRCU6_09115 [Fusobacteriaceae bacterium]
MDTLSTQSEPTQVPVVEIHPEAGIWGNLLLLAFSVGAVNILIKSIADYAMEKMRTKKQVLKLSETLEDIAKIYDNLQQILNGQKADCVTMCKVTNGGDIPKVTTPLHITMLYEVTNQTIYSVKEFWQNRLVSKDLFEEIKKTYSGFQEYKKGDILEEIFDAEDLDNLIMAPIGSTDKEFYFIQIKYKNKIAFEMGYNEAKLIGFTTLIRNLMNLNNLF